MQVKSKGSSLNAVELAEKVKEDLIRSKGGQVIQQSGKVNQNQKLCRTFGHCKTDLDGEEVVKRVERKLASLEARVKNGEGGDVMKQRVELVRNRLQRYYFLAQLLPLSKCPLEFTAFLEKYREQRLKENLVNNDRQGIGDKSRENLGSENQHNEQQIGVGCSWVNVRPNTNQGLAVQHCKGMRSSFVKEWIQKPMPTKTDQVGSQLSVITTTNQGLVVQHAKVNRRGRWDMSETVLP